MAKENINSQLSRMKALMNYGLQTESKQAYSSVEYSKVGADGKTYGILREGAKYYIKVAPKKDNLVKEDFSYIGGFRNRKDNEYTSYANAQKQFDLKMRSINEAYSNDKHIVIESWNPDKQQELTVEATENMRKEILRERQIMANAAMIMTEGQKKSQNMKNEFKAVTQEGSEADNKAPKSDAKKTDDSTKDYHGKKMNCKGGDPFCEKPNCCNESAEVLGFNRDNDEYMDKSHGTKIGPSAPHTIGVDKDADAVAKQNGGEEESSSTEGVNEEVALHATDNQNSPSVGTGEIGDDAPFNGEKGRQIDEADELDGEDPESDDMMGIDDSSSEADAEGIADDEAGNFGDEGMTDTDFGAEDDVDLDIEDGAEDDFSDDELDDELEDEEEDDDLYSDDIESRLDNIENVLVQLANKLGIENNVDGDVYDDDEDLYDDGEDSEDEPEYDLEPGDENGEEDDEEEIYGESRNYRGVRILETRNYRRLMNEENRLNDFGKHPAYQKKVMTYPDPDMQEFPDYYDMNDDSVRGEQPYGQKIGDTAPFTISPETIENSIAESINRILGRKKK